MRPSTSRSIAVAVVATLLLSSAVFAAGDQGDPVAQSGDGGNSVVLPFTKWITADPGFPITAGTVSGEAAGPISGEILVRQLTASKDIMRLEAVYEIQAGDHSFKALLQGGQNNLAGTGLLDGTILGGWHTGARVHVDYHIVSPCGQANAFNDTCFAGTISIATEPAG
jgi:hypothetical protein